MAQQCGSCHAQSPDGAKFCLECGTPFARACPSCGTPAGAGKFCGECGTPLSGATPAPAATVATNPGGSSGPVSERRLTSVLFGDLVSFTTLSEQRDPEEVRELLSEYFAVARTVVGRYGGTIEKFIGDAVMAVWGVPVSHEDDAERAVRAGLELVAEVTALGARVNAPGLAMRVGVVTGSVAVTLGAVNEGMVAGDAVNTAARVQSAAEPATVWTDGETRSLTAAAIAYSDMGEHELKGKAESMQLFRADAVVAARGGAQRVDGLEAPLTGRDNELRAIKELFHAVEADGRSRLVVVEGHAGIGKTRLGWEFEKYVDGLTAGVNWHRGRCLSYGEGVGFWAFAEMMRSRLGLLEDDGHTQVSAKVQEGVRAVARDDAEADWLAPRLLELLGAGGTGRRFERPDLFSAWSTYLERLGSGEPVVLLFEDMQHADAGLLDFVDYLLESGVARLFIMVCARPELRERRPSLVAGSRSSVVVASRLDDVAMAELIDGLVADLPARARSAIVARSEGVPLYAVETVRSLIDRDAVVPRDGRYVFDDPDGSKVDLAQLSAPTSLQTLIAARLDALTATERRVVQDASVLGLAFRQAGVEKLCGLPPAEIDIAMLGLVRKGVIETQLDPRSPELGQYRFLQALVREVAYSTLARKDRKVRHLAAADHLASEGEAAETFSGVIAQHLLDALEASATTDPDRPTIAERARDLLVVAADRAESLGAPDEALHCSLAAMELEPDEAEMLPLRERAARVAVAAGEYLRGVDLATDAADAYRRSGDEVGAARSTMYLAWSLLNLGRNEEALVAIEPAFEKIRNHGDADETICDLAHALTVVLRAIRPPEAAYPVLMTQVRLAERLGDPARQVQALNGVAIHLALFGSVAGYLALLERAAEMAEEHHLPIALARSLSNLLSEIYRRDLPRAREVATDAMAASRRAGSVQYMENALVNASFTWWMAGEWDLLRDNAADWFATHVANPLSSLLIMPFTLACAERQVELPVIALTHSDFPAEQSFADVTLALRQEAAGDLDGAAKAASAALRRGFTDIDVLEDFEVLWTPTVELQLRAGHVEEAEALLTFGPAAESAIRCEVGAAMAPRLAGLVAIAKGEDPEQLLRAAELEFTAYGAPYYLARTRLELGRWLCDQGRAAEGMPLLDLARTGLVELGALRSLTELEAAASASGLAVSA